MLPKTTTFGLVERAKSGDNDAFASLFDHYRRRLAVLIHFRLGDDLRASVEVDDVLQEVFLRAFRDIHAFTYRAPGSYMSWLASITSHVITDLARYQGREVRRAVETLRFRSESNPNGPEPADTLTPSRILRHKEDFWSLIEKLNALPDDYREVILLAKVEGLSTIEIAARLSRSREAVAVLLHRAIKRLRATQAV